MSFTWIPFYKELANKLLVYRARQAELLALLKELKGEGVPVISLVDKDKNGKNVSLAVMDPFTFFATFNRRITDKNRKLILAAIKTKLHVEAAVPSDFDGIPVMNPQKSRFFPFEADRKNDNIDSLWELAEAVVQKTPDELEPTLIDRCLNFKGTGIANLSMGMYWMRPATYIALDRRNCDLLDRQGISRSAEDGSSYLAFLKDAQNAINKAPFEFSLQAYESTVSPRYWVFQARPELYDIVGALRDGKLKSWTIKTHKRDINRGDRVIIWVTGKEAGCYALCEITSNILKGTDVTDFEDYVYYKQSPANGPLDHVEIKVVLDLHDSPVTKDEVGTAPALTKLNVGNQGTVFTATAAQYQAIEKLAAAKLGAGLNGRKYWLYAPGPNAKYWDQCRENGEMVIGFDDLIDLTSFQHKEDIVKALQKARKTKANCKNDALAAWQFVHEVKPDDIIIAKRGTKAYLGYGVVKGEYRFEKDREGYRNIRDVDWKEKGEWLEPDGPIVQKMLTDITKDPDYVDKLKNMIGIEDPTRNPINLPSKNVILYGPPGTGKTHALRTEYMEYFTDYHGTKSQKQYAYADDLVASMAFWEVITMVMLDLGQAKVPDILDHALLQARIRRTENRHQRAVVAHMQMHTKRDCEHVTYSKRYEPLLFEKSDKSVWSIDKEAAHTEVPDLVDKLKEFKAYKATDTTVIRRYSFTTFHQSFSYEDFIEGIKPVMGEDVAGDLAYEIQPGIFRQIALRAKNDPGHDYALFIDEINRGNIASIFGELITLVEDDKRIKYDKPLSEDKRLEGAQDMKVLLPYSRDEFGVPANLYVVGTMNTADRSIEALDTALRRRFTFVPYGPKPSLLKAKQPKRLDIDLEKLLTTINARIERLLDTDHCIGHSYFMKLGSASDPLLALRQVFANNVLPLLQEYFYGDTGRIGMILGEKFVKRREDGAKLVPGDWGVDGVDERYVYQLENPMELPLEAFVSIYA